MRRMQKKIIVAMGAITFAALALVGSAGVASSGPTADVPTVQLTDTQKQELQAQVNEQLKNYGGGKQIGINQISYGNGRMILTLPLPGETKARAIDELITPLGTANCRFEWACLWSDTNFNGTKLEKFFCDRIVLAFPFSSSTGSIHNNQTSGTQTMILNSSQQILNANLAPSKINDTGVGSRGNARYWQVC